MFAEYNKSVVIDGDKLLDTIRVFNELGISKYEFVELGLGKSNVFCVAFRASKKTFNKFLARVRVNYISVK